MANLTPIRDAAGDIIGLAPSGQHQPTGFAALLAETMAATGATVAAVGPEQAEEPPSRHSIGRFELAGIVCGLVVALVLIALINSLMPAQEAPRAPAQPTTTQQQPTIAAPAVAAPVAPTATPAPTTATPEPPTQTPAVVYVETACYSVTEDVYSADKRAVIGQVTGQSCESQEAAQAAADALAAAMRGE